MIKAYKLTISILLCLVIVSCTNTGNKENVNSVIDSGDTKSLIRIKNNSPYVIRPDEALKTDLSEDGNVFISNQKLIALDLANGPIGKITKIIMHQDRIYIVDETRNNECVFIFDSKGRSINKIDKRGKGPEEFLAIESFLIDTVTKEIMLMDQLMPNMLYFDLDGNFKRKERFKFNFSKLSNVDGQFVYSTSYGQNKLNKFYDGYTLFIGSINKLSHYGFPRQVCDKNMWCTSSFSTNYNSKLLYTPSFSDSVYLIPSDSTYKIHTVFEFKRSVFEESLKYDQLTTEEMDEIINSCSMQWGNGVLETKHFIFYSCILNDDKVIKYHIFCKDNNKSYQVGFNGFYGSVESIKNIFEMPITISQDFVVSVSDPCELLNKYNSIRKMDKSIERAPIADVLKTLKPDDNPILVFSKFDLNRN